MVWRALACSAAVFVFDHFMNTSLRTLTLAAAVASLFPAVALGQTAPEQQTEESPPVVVTATRVAQPLTDVLADVTLIDEQQIQRSGAVNITDLLARQPGLELSRNGGPGTASSLFIRGADTRFTAVYIDGVRVDSQSTGGAPWEAIALGQVERIEIVRGPAAAVYGSDAGSGRGANLHQKRRRWFFAVCGRRCGQPPYWQGRGNRLFGQNRRGGLFLGDRACHQPGL